MTKNKMCPILLNSTPAKLEFVNGIKNNKNRDIQE